MTILSITGTVAGTTSETNLFDITKPTTHYFCTQIFVDNMATNDDYTFRVYILDEVISVMKLYAVHTFSDSQAIPAINIPFIPTKRYRVSVQKTGGVDKNFNWNRIEVIDIVPE